MATPSFTQVLQQLRAKRLRQQEALEATEQHIRAIEELDKQGGKGK